MLLAAAETRYINTASEQIGLFSEITKLWGDDDVVDLFFRLAEQLQKFQFTAEERALFTVITLLSPGALWCGV